MKFVCPICHDDWLPESEDPKYKGMCVSCDAERHCKELEAKWDKELNIYKKRTGIEYDFEGFWYAIQRGEVNKSDLKRLPELKSIYEDALGYLKELEQDGFDPQLELNFDGNDLPF